MIGVSIFVFSTPRTGTRILSRKHIFMLDALAFSCGLLFETLHEDLRGQQLEAWLISSSLFISTRGMPASAVWAYFFKMSSVVAEKSVLRSSAERFHRLQTLA